MEGMPSPCFNGPYNSRGPGSLLARLGLAGYVRRHDPWMYYNDISGNPARCRQVVPLAELGPALQADQLPDFVWITPAQQHDMHNGSIEDGDRWLASFVPPILASPAWRDNGVLFVIWDEGQGSAGCCGEPGGGHTLALVIAAQGRRGFRSDIPYDHYSVLRTIEEAWQLGLLGHAADPGIRPLADTFR